MKKITGDELPDFYNIVLERPRDDPDGYDVLFIDAAAKARCACCAGHAGHATRTALMLGRAWLCLGAP